MAFILRVVTAVVLALAITIVICAAILFLVWGINRVLQFFLGLLGYEVGDFFGWLVSKLPIRKKRKRRLS